ncbi:helix-turn-helix domain-containing protein [Ferrovum myxofaciens]|uniref:helix-turn-helix domain-containing protein n=1 Tax=Ferrovum myxofaciens TaxID=416213 RepID=UPI000A03258D|nr:helix-turn-helix transcriptional regulator [Ferrovum myxofaciens]
MMNDDKTQEGRTAFGARLYEARKAKGFTQKQVETRIGIAQSTLAELEHEGKGSAYVVDLALLYEVNPVWLAKGIQQRIGTLPAPPWLIELNENEYKQTEQFAKNLIFARPQKKNPLAS